MHANDQKRRGVVVGALEHCLLELTGACNLSCRHCYAEDLPRVCLDMDKLIETVFQVEGRLPKMVTLSGGEPLLVEGVLAFAARLRERGVELSLATNGTLVDQPLAKHLAGVLGTAEYWSIGDREYWGQQPILLVSFAPLRPLRGTGGRRLRLPPQ